MVSTENVPREYKVIGTRPIRPDGLEKVTGSAIYGADIKMPGLVWGAVLRSPHAHARINRLDVSEVSARPGVLAVMTAEDLPEAHDKVVDLGEGDIDFHYASQRIMASDKVIFRGQPLVAVAAIDANTAKEALKLVEVEYEVLKPVINVHEAMAADAPLVLEDLTGDHLGEKVSNTNVAEHFLHEFGDVNAGFSNASTIVEHEYDLSTVHQGYIEPHNATAIWNRNNHNTIWTSTQVSFSARRQTAGLLVVPESSVKVVPLEIGGGFGGKIPVYLEPIAAVLSKKCGRPVKLLMDRASVFESTGPTPGAWVRVKMGVDESGRITAGEADIRFEAGAFPGSPVGAAAKCVFACYDIPNTKVDGYDVIVNKTKTAAYRAPGATQAAFAVETIVDEICEKIGMDRLEFRLLNASHEGTRRSDGPRFPRIGNIEVVEAAKASPHWKTPLTREGKGGRKRGRGFASGYWFNVGLKSSVSMSLNDDGTVALVEGSTDIGGTRASIAMQAAEVLGVNAEDVLPTVVDTDSVGFTDVTGGSRVCFATGAAACAAAQNLIKEMCKRAAMIWEIAEGDVKFEDGNFFAKSNPALKLSFKQLAGRIEDTGGPVTATASVNMEDDRGGFGAHIVDLEIDPDTGKTDVVRYTVVQDAGKAIHPAYVEGQMQGGAVQGVGWALNEEYFMDDSGAMKNSSFLDYRLPTSLDLPPIETIIVEVANPDHPFGVRGVGETPIVPPVGAIANAIYDAVGIRLCNSPMNPGRILEALSSGNGK